MIEMVYLPRFPGVVELSAGGPPLATVENSFQYRGDLSQTALPEILYTIDRFQVPGVIEATSRGEVAKQVYIKEGNVVHATSTDRNDSLGTYLQRSGVLSAEVYLETMRERERSGMRYGELLIERRLLSPAEVYRAIRKQTEAIVWSLFYWQEGSVVFSIGEFREADSVRIQLPMQQVILQGIKRAPDAKTLVARLGRKETILEPCYKTEHLIELALDADEYKLLRLVDGKRTLYEICTQGPHSASDNAKLLYAFQILQLIRSQATVSAPPPEPRHAEATGTGAIRIRFKTQGDKFRS
jgi:hypothetical protein